MKSIRAIHVIPAAVLAAAILQSPVADSQQLSPAISMARDPGVRGGAPSAGSALPGLSAKEQAYFAAGLADFLDVEGAADGLGPTMNLDSCAGCHAQPAVGGSSPAVNPQAAFAGRLGAANRLPDFIRSDGPIREARFVNNADGSADGGVHAVFTIGGRADAPGCRLAQPDFAAQSAAHNVVFRIPTPVFGAGLIESIPDSAILANANADASLKQPLGIRGRANVSVAGRTVSGQGNANGNDGTVARFGWKAQNKSLLLFSGEAYNVEMGISNEIFPTERDETANCQYARVPNDALVTEALTPIDGLLSIERFAVFQRFLAPPQPSSNTPGGSASIQRGRQAFAATGCALCHTPTLQTGNAAVAALRNKQVNLYSDLLVHDMGPDLADGVSQGQAGPSEFRTAPLWGLGQRVFFLHDGRASDLVKAIQAHQSGTARAGNASEANGVVNRYGDLSESQKQDLLNFLRSL